VYVVEHTGEHSMLKQFSFQMKYGFLLAEVEQVYHKMCFAQAAVHLWLFETSAMIGEVV
jgi:hypothetical protein